MAINFDDPYVEKQVIAEQHRRGDRVKTRTARNLILERLAQIDPPATGPTQPSQSPPPAAAAS